MPAETRTLPVRLTIEEKIQRGQKLAGCMAKKTEIENKLKEHKAKAKADLEIVEQEISSLSHELRAGEQYISVEVTRTKDWDRGVEEVLRADTGEVVDTRPLTPAERQMRLDEANRPTKGRGKTNVTPIK